MTEECVQELEEAKEWYDILRERSRKLDRQQGAQGEKLMKLKDQCDHKYPDGSSATVANPLYAECQICGGSR